MSSRRRMTLTAEELESSLQCGKVPFILDVRCGVEFRSGHIPGATHAPLPAVVRMAERLSPDRESLLVLVCEHGPRAQMARMFLKFRGYKNVDLLEGHMTRWRGAGRPVQSGSG